MRTELENIEVTKNDLRKNFEFIVDGKKAFIDFKEKGGVTYLLYAEVPPALRGQGVGEAMVEKTLTLLQAENKKVVPVCGFIATCIKRKPEWSRMLAEA